jgi:hypothetical protein
MWTAVAINLVFVLGFEEHGPGAQVCTTSWFVDFGVWGKPFFHLSPWVMLILALLHLASSGARLASNAIQRLVFSRVEARREVLTALDAPEPEPAAPPEDGADKAGEGDKAAAAAAAAAEANVSLGKAVRSLATDKEVVFTGVLMLSSVLGFFWSPFFYAIPLIDLLRSPTVLLLLKSVQHNANKLGQGALVGLLLVYGHAIIGYGLFQGDHQEGKCENLFGCSMTYAISGMKGDSIESALEDLATPAALWVNPSMWARIALDMSFYTIIPLVLLSIISGQCTARAARPCCAAADSSLSLRMRCRPDCVSERACLPACLPARAHSRRARVLAGVSPRRARRVVGGCGARMAFARAKRVLRAHVAQRALTRGPVALGRAEGGRADAEDGRGARGGAGIIIDGFGELRDEENEAKRYRCPPRPGGGLRLQPLRPSGLGASLPPCAACQGLPGGCVVRPPRGAASRWLDRARATHRPPSTRARRSHCAQPRARRRACGPRLAAAGGGWYRRLRLASGAGPRAQLSRPSMESVT